MMFCLGAFKVSRQCVNPVTSCHLRLVCAYKTWLLNTCRHSRPSLCDSFDFMVPLFIEVLPNQFLSMRHWLENFSFFSKSHSILLLAWPGHLPHTQERLSTEDTFFGSASSVGLQRRSPATVYSKAEWLRGGNILHCASSFGLFPNLEWAADL